DIISTADRCCRDQRCRPSALLIHRSTALDQERDKITIHPDRSVEKSDVIAARIRRHTQVQCEQDRQAPTSCRRAYDEASPVTDDQPADEKHKAPGDDAPQCGFQCAYLSHGPIRASSPKKYLSAPDRPRPPRPSDVNPPSGSKRKRLSPRTIANAEWSAVK